VWGPLQKHKAGRPCHTGSLIQGTLSDKVFPFCGFTKDPTRQSLGSLMVLHPTWQSLGSFLILQGAPPLTRYGLSCGFARGLTWQGLGSIVVVRVTSHDNVWAPLWF
jgi:hypothetical protein